MCDVNPMFHMDERYMWRWYITSANGKLLCMSVDAFFSYEEARWNYDNTMRKFNVIAA